MRDAKTFGEGKKPHPVPVTMMYISEGIKKLRAVYLNKLANSEEKEVSTHAHRQAHNTCTFARLHTDEHDKRLCMLSEEHVL